MKKLTLACTLALTLASALTARATDYVVWKGADLGDDEVQLETLNYASWWNCARTELNDGIYQEGQVRKYYEASDVQYPGTGWSAGIELQNNAIFSTLADMDLVFQARSEGSATYNVRLTAPDTDYTAYVPADGSYYQYRLSVNDLYNAVTSNWSAATDESSYYVFSVIASSDASDDAAFYVTDIRYTAHVDIPTVSVESTDVTANSGTLQFNVTWPEGYTDCKLFVDGAEVTDKQVTFTDLDSATAYGYTVVARGVYDGQTYCSNPIKASFTTEATAEALAMDYVVWKGADLGDGEVQLSSIVSYDWWNSSVTALEDENYADGQVRKYSANASSGYSAAAWSTGLFLTNTSVFSTLADMDLVFMGRGEGSADYQIRLTSPDTNYVPYLPSDDTYYQYRLSVADLYGAVVDNWKAATDNSGYYVFSIVADNASDDAAFYVTDIRYTAHVDIPEVEVTGTESTENSATLTFNVTWPDGYTDCKLLVDGVEASDNTVTFTNLDATTAYNFTVVAQGQYNGQTYCSNPMKASVTTAAVAGTEFVYHGYGNFDFTSSKSVTATDVTRGHYYWGVPYTITYNDEQLLVIEVETADIDVLGLVPQVNVAGTYISMTAGENGKYAATSTATFGKEESVSIFFYFTYSGGAARTDVSGYTAGAENDEVILGEVASISLESAKYTLQVNNPTEIYTLVTDENGYYLNGSELLYSCEDVNGTYGDGSFTAAAKGEYTLVATAGSVKGSILLNVVVSETSFQLTTDDFTASTADDLQTNSKVENAFDGNLNTELQWATGTDHQENTLTVVLNDPLYIEAIELVWEGASAKAYTVTITAPADASDDEDVSDSTPMLKAESDEESNDTDGLTEGYNLFTVTDGDGGSGAYYNTLAPESSLPQAGTITLTTSLAYNSGWGIKLKEMTIYANEEDTGTSTGIDALSAAEPTSADTAVYDLTGRRVAGSLAERQLPAGIYISAGRKVLVK